MTTMEDVAAKVLPSDVGYEWTAMSYQEKVTGNRILDGKPILEAAVDAGIRFRPILMTSFAFILGVLPPVLATGAGANARKSLGISVFTGMIASTCLAVVFPGFFRGLAAAR
jgi:HAE1 family hydrophobic/amphiphilic exporter-1